MSIGLYKIIQLVSPHKSVSFVITNVTLHTDWVVVYTTQNILYLSVAFYKNCIDFHKDNNIKNFLFVQASLFLSSPLVVVENGA